jgi:hypothetical protein
MNEDKALVSLYLNLLKSSLKKGANQCKSTYHYAITHFDFSYTKADWLSLSLCCKGETELGTYYRCVNIVRIQFQICPIFLTQP